jgi:hypothetical protein
MTTANDGSCWRAAQWAGNQGEGAASTDTESCWRPSHWVGDQGHGTLVAKA